MIEVTLPSGSIAEFPDGTDPELMRARALQLAAQERNANPDANLGGTLQLGVPFTGKRLDTGIPLPSWLESGIVGAGKSTNDLVAGVRQAYNAATGNTQGKLLGIPTTQ